MTEQELREIGARWSNRNFNLPPDIEALIAEVRRLRCCGNCKWYKNCKKYDSISGSDKCDKWEAADNG